MPTRKAPLHRLLFQSRACPLQPRHAELWDILNQSERNNAAWARSGLMYACAEGYLQVVEGPERAIAALRDALEADRRHDVAWLTVAEISGRSVSRHLPLGIVEATEPAARNVSWSPVRVGPRMVPQALELLWSLLLRKFPSMAMGDALELPRARGGEAVA